MHEARNGSAPGLVSLSFCTAKAPSSSNSSHCKLRCLNRASRDGVETEVEPRFLRRSARSYSAEIRYRCNRGSTEHRSAEMLLLLKAGCICRGIGCNGSQIAIDWQKDNRIRGSVCQAKCRKQGIKRHNIPLAVERRVGRHHGLEPPESLLLIATGCYSCCFPISIEMDLSMMQ